MEMKRTILECVLLSAVLMWGSDEGCHSFLHVLLFAYALNVPKDSFAMRQRTRCTVLRNCSIGWRGCRRWCFSLSASLPQWNQSKCRSVNDHDSDGVEPPTFGNVSLLSSKKFQSHTYWGGYFERTADEIKSFAENSLFGCTSTVGNKANCVEVLNVDPPLLLIHNFLEHEMCDAIMESALNKPAAEGGFRRSFIGEEQESSDIRTSETAWLRDEDCPVPLRTFADRAARLSGLNPCTQENLQVVRYRPGQQFDLHTDHLESFNMLDRGGRLATCLLYLNSATSSDAGRPSFPTDYPSTLNRCDQEHEMPSSSTTFTGGATQFPEFDISTLPTKGSAIFFWNTLERPGMEGYDPLMFLHVDMRLRHAGLPVVTGEKWACNRWIHPIDFGAGVRGE